VTRTSTAFNHGEICQMAAYSLHKAGAAYRFGSRCFCIEYCGLDFLCVYVIKKFEIRVLCLLGHFSHTSGSFALEYFSDRS
jgi:hypothetical protein